MSVCCLVGMYFKISPTKKVTGCTVSIIARLFGQSFSATARELSVHDAVCCRYGVREFVIITPEKGVEALTSQAQAKLMLSSVSIAIANTHW